MIDIYKLIDISDTEQTGISKILSDVIIQSNKKSNAESIKELIYQFKKRQYNRFPQSVDLIRSF